jgi:hypothetical protein
MPQFLEIENWLPINEINDLSKFPWGFYPKYAVLPHLVGSILISQVIIFRVKVMKLEIVKSRLGGTF